MLKQILTCVDPEGGTGVPGPPLKNHKNTGFLSDTGPDSLEKCQHTMLGHHRPARETPF